jgi:two-component system, chemotaxis family, protein-glutamate methylesterase/glutaminase
VDPTASGPPPVVVVGASAGGVEALQRFAASLPAGFPCCVLVVLHIPATGHSALPSILDRAGPLTARQADDGTAIRAGEILVAPPDHHLVVLDGRVAITRGPQENGHRPAVDVLFRSAARALGHRVAGVVLSGALDDGAAGAVAVAERGGLCLVEDFEEALYSGMPRATFQAVSSAKQIGVAEMAQILGEWSRTADDADPDAPSVLLEMEAEMAELDPDAMHDTDRPGTPAGFGCPDCAGALYQIEDGGLRRFRCRVGHAWSPESLLARQSIAMESALWMALRGLEEKAALNIEMAERAKYEGRPMVATRFIDNAAEARRAAELVRQLLADIGTGDAPPLKS